MARSPIKKVMYITREDRTLDIFIHMICVSPLSTYVFQDNIKKKFKL